MIYFGFIARNRPYLICDRENNYFILGYENECLCYSKYSQINFSDMKPTLAFILYRADENNKLIEI